MAYSNLNNTQNHQLATFGQKGFDYVTGSASASLGTHYNAVTCLEDAVLTVTSVNGDSLSGVVMPAGATVYGLFTAVSITEGSILAYIA